MCETPQEMISSAAVMHASTGIFVTKSDWIFGRLVQVFWIRTIVHDAIVNGRATGIVYRPSDNRQIPTHQRNLWPLGDLYVLGSWSRWTLLSERGAAQNQNRQCQKHLFHVRTSKRISPG